MTWTNAFDVGPCTVKVTRAGTDLYSGVLTKGGASANFAGWSGEVVNVTVDVDGVVALNNVSGSTSSNAKYELRVIPTYDIAAAFVQASDIILSYPQGNQYGYADYATQVTENVPVVGDGDTADLSGLYPVTEISVYMGEPV